MGNKKTDSNNFVAVNCLTKPIASISINVSSLNAGNYLVKVGANYSEKITIVK